LMRACRANFSPLFSLYHDSERKIASILSQVVQGKPLMSLQTKRSNLPDSNESHTLWAITDAETKRELSKLLSSQLIYIADGHHRYETALIYQQERAQEQSLTNKRAFNYVMMELVEFSDPGLLVLPLHRLVRGITSSILVKLGEQLRDFFAVELVPLKTNGSDASALLGDSCLGILGLQPNLLVRLKKRQDVSLEALMPANRSQAYRDFDVSILNHIILDKLMGLTSTEDITYTVDLKEAYRQIKDGKYQLAFLLNRPQPEMVKAVADAQDRMPGKSTYFYPKLPTGLVINPLD